MKKIIPKQFSPAMDTSSILCINAVTVNWHDNETVDSTMDSALSMLDSGAPSWTLVTASNQSNGRGTHGRKWFSSSGLGLYFSIILPLPESIDMLDGLTSSTADILVETLLKFTGPLDYIVKQPNDVLIGGKKVAGILYETQSDSDGLTALIFGLGLNLTQSTTDFLNAELPDATSLQIESGTAPETLDFIRMFLDAFIPMYYDLTGISRTEARMS